MRSKTVNYVKIDSRQASAVCRCHTLSFHSLVRLLCVVGRVRWTTAGFRPHADPFVIDCFGSRSVLAAVLDARRVDARDRLDRASNVVVRGNQVSFRQSFETIESDETFCAAPADVVAAGRRLLTCDMTPGLARVVHDTVTVKIGCNNVPVFSTARGGRSRTQRLSVVRVHALPDSRHSHSSPRECHGGD